MERWRIFAFAELSLAENARAAARTRRLRAASAWSSRAIGRDHRVLAAIWVGGEEDLRVRADAQSTGVPFVQGWRG
jgi:hypothetical protein